MDVQEPLLKSSWDTLLFGGPLVAMLLLGFFGLDRSFSAPKRKARVRVHVSRSDPRHQPPSSDPDGRPWRPRPSGKKG